MTALDTIIVIDKVHFLRQCTSKYTSHFDPLTALAYRVSRK